MKGYLFNCQCKAGDGTKLNGYVVSETSGITSATPLTLYIEGWSSIPDFDESFNICAEHAWDYRLCGITETSEMEASRVDYNKNLGKYIEVEHVGYDYTIIGTSLTCADLEDTGKTYTLIYHDRQGRVVKGDLTFKSIDYTEGDTIYNWGNDNIDVCLYVYCLNGIIYAEYLG